MSPSAWALPPEILMDVIEYLRPATTIHDHSEAWITPMRYTNWWTLEAANEEVPSNATPTHLIPPSAIPPQVGMDFIRLRAVSRDFYNMCTPFLYHEVNINGDYIQLRDVHLPVISKYGRFVRILRIVFPLPTVEEEEEKQDFIHLIHKILPLTPQVTSLHLYFPSESRAILTPTEHLQTLINCIPWESLESFGVYSRGIFHSVWPSWPSAMSNGILAALTEMPPRRRRALRRLDIANESIPEQVFDSIRSNFTTLESLTIRRSLRFDGKIWDNNNQRKWNPNLHLTCLQLIDCTSVYSAHVPRILHLFPSLKRLLISACGNWGDEIPPSREEGWSQRSDALHRRLPYLEEFLIEHMVKWEILAMGEISSRLVIATGLPLGDLVDAFKTDAEIFPGLRHLRLDKRFPHYTPTAGWEEDSIPTTVESQGVTAVEPIASAPAAIELPPIIPVPVGELEQICRDRGIELSRDAVHLAFSNL